MKQYLLIDIGGTFIKYSLADEQARKISGGKVPTPLTNMDDLLAAIEGFAAPLQGQFVGCAISMPGRIDTRNGIAHTGGMLSAFMWEQPFAAQVEARLGVPVTIANDGKCAAAAEGWTGALAGVENGLVLVLGTGIGGIILNGKVLMGAHAAAGEVSGLVSNMAAMETETFEMNKVETFSDAPLWAGAASATGLIREYARQKKLSLQGPLPTGEEIFAAYNAGEPEAQKALKIFARRVAVGILSLQHVLDVEKVAIGGGISAAEALLPAIQAELDWLFERCTVMPAVKPELVRCRYGNDANLIGALKLFFEQNPA
ncbi:MULTISPECIES: ROK family protein [Faecalibacterium]|uniref:ROK family protein n=1 Tax=Faecalibacterium TaxID=216851 RepID=UPI0012DD2ABB|nr:MULTISPECIES: ROK family protein [Faecalibacterium]MBO1309523.1 ROK family protein [Faecalibacterium sp. Marseille-Q4164]